MASSKRACTAVFAAVKTFAQILYNGISKADCCGKRDLIQKFNLDPNMMIQILCQLMSMTAIKNIYISHDIYFRHKVVDKTVHVFKFFIFSKIFVILIHAAGSEHSFLIHYHKLRSYFSSLEDRLR